MSREIILTRRSFVKNSLQLAAGIVMASPLESIAALAKQPMSFYHTHTGERLKINYSCEGCASSTLKKLNNFLRDFRTGDVHPIDPALLDILYRIQQKSGSRGVIEIISGFRSPKTNNRLRTKSSGVARKSLHMKGRALDIRMTDLNTRDLRDVSISLRQGGVGYYAKSDFVHIDTGRVRTW
ncbi:MAG: DUF882 domain-containing protein [Desulfobulbaceae bacterium]|nr:DUF882 domain-containing protein [Desulfobulbaceae bacterium]